MMKQTSLMQQFSGSGRGWRVNICSWLKNLLDDLLRSKNDEEVGEEGGGGNPCAVAMIILKWHVLST